MPLQLANVLSGFFDGGRMYETPGIIFDLDNLADVPFVFSVNPPRQTRTKTLIVQDHVIPGRHAPLQEPVSGGAERLELEVLLLGSGPLALGATYQGVKWLESLLFPDRGGLTSVVGGLVSNGFNRKSGVNLVGHRISLTYGLWIIEKPYYVRNISVTSGPGHDPITLLPYRALIRMNLQEAQEDNIDFVEQRYGIPSGDFLSKGRLGF